MHAAIHELAAEEIAAWRRDGFVVLDQFVDSVTLDRLRRAYDDILYERIVAEGDRVLGTLTRQVMFPSKAHPVFDQNAAVEAGVSIARQLFGVEQARRSFDMLIYKAPGHPHETPWHQDAAYGVQPFAAAGSPISDREIQFWLPVDDVDIENGCMQFIPGCHTAPLLEHYVAAGDPADESRLLALVDPIEQLNLTRRVVAEIPAGGVTMHASGTPH
ncbi:MAG: phytanoyl-CoA dioxygenase family protein, partial [Mycobacterium sp.]|nr:phytanoyl-CoA dioxygenase family protein [Mycobacterium sp.]